MKEGYEAGNEKGFEKRIKEGFEKSNEKDFKKGI